MTRENLIKAARIGYLEAQQRLDWDLGDRVHYYDATSSFYDENSKFARVTVSEATLEGAPSGVYVNYVWNDEDGDVAAAVHFAHHDTEGEWFFDGNVEVGNEEIDKHTSGSLEDVRAHFKEFCDEFSTKVNAVYASNVVQELDDDNLEL